MKKITILLASLFILSACSDTSSASDNIPAETTSNIVTEAETTSDIATETTASREPDFRNVNWGMSKSEIIAAEGTPDVDFVPDDGVIDPQSVPIIRYNNVNVVDYNAELTYWLSDGTLNRAEYNFNCDNKTDYEIHTMYYDILSEYTKKYGEPYDSSKVILNPDAQYVIDNPLLAKSDLSFGDTAIYSDKWNNANGASIDMSMNYSNVSDSKFIFFTITYQTVDDNI